MADEEIDPQDEKDARELLKWLTWEIREAATDKVRDRFRYGHDEPSEDVLQGLIDEETESMLSDAGRKLGKLLTSGIKL